MDHYFCVVIALHRHDFEEISSSVGSEVQHLVLTIFSDDHGMVDAVFDIAIADSVSARRAINLHDKNIVIRNPAGSFSVGPAGTS